MLLDIETAVADEWLTLNASVAYVVTSEAYNETERILQENWALRHRNVAFARGQLRYFLTASLLDICASEGRMPGITSRWEACSCDVLVLASKSFEVEVCHTNRPDELPHPSLRRETAIVSNQGHLGTILEETRPRKIVRSENPALFLLHGAKELSFMHLVCPDSLQKKAAFYYRSPNFAHLPHSVSKDDVEDIKQALPKVAAELIDRLRSGSNE